MLSAFLTNLPRFRDGLGSIALFTFAGFAWLGTTVAHVALATMALMTIAQGPETWRRLGRDPFVRLTGIFFAYALLSGLWAVYQWPDTSREQWRSLWPWCSLWCFFVVGWWIQARWSRVIAVSILAPMGLVISIVRHTDWARLPAWLAGERYEFGFTSLGLSFLCVVIALALIASFPRIARGVRRSRLGSIYVAVALVFLVFFLAILLIAQSRGAWLSLAFGLLCFVTLVFWVRTQTRAGMPAPPRMLLPLLLSLVAAGTLWGAFGGSMQARFASEVNLLPELAHLEVDKLPYSSGPARLHLATWGMRLFRERPVFGWGPGTEATTYLAANGFHGMRDGFLRVVRHFAHLHNVYVEILVRFGLVGAALFVAAFALLGRSPFQNWRQGIIPTDFFMGSVTILLATLFSGFYEFRLLHTDFRFFMLVFGGLVYTFALHPPQHVQKSDAGWGLPVPDSPPSSRAPFDPGIPS